MLKQIRVYKTTNRTVKTVKLVLQSENGSALTLVIDERNCAGQLDIASLFLVNTLNAYESLTGCFFLAVASVEIESLNNASATIDVPRFTRIDWDFLTRNTAEDVVAELVGRYRLLKEEIAKVGNQVDYASHTLGELA